MAVSKAAQEKVEVLNGLDLIWDSRAIIADILYHFREFHDLCVESKLFKDKTILNIDQCAVDFRQISFDTVTVAKRVSKQWLDSTIAFFENIDDVDDPREMLILLGRQAGDLASCFKIIAAWSRDLAGRFHQAQDGTVKEVKEFQDKFKEAEARAVDIKKQIEEKHAEAQQDREKAKDSERTWKAAVISLAWIPFGFVVTAIGASFAEGRADEMAKKAAETDEKLKTAQKELQQRTSQHERAKVRQACFCICGRQEKSFRASLR